MSERHINAREEDDMAMQIADAPLDIREITLDLTKPEKVRTVALMMGIRYHVDTIIKDPKYLELMMQKEKEAKFSNDPDRELWHLRPSTALGVVTIATMFEAYLLGQPSPIASIRYGDDELPPGVGRAQREVQDNEESAL